MAKLSVHRVDNATMEKLIEAFPSKATKISQGNNRMFWTVDIPNGDGIEITFFSHNCDRHTPTKLGPN